MLVTVWFAASHASIAQTGKVQIENTDARMTAIGLLLPATFEGSLPCADCEGIDHKLALWPNGGFHLSRVWRGGEGELRDDAVGGWIADPSRQAVVLQLGEGEVLSFEVKGADTVRLLDREGNPIQSELNYDLIGDAKVRGVELENLFLSGMVTQSDQRPVFAECFSGQAFAMAQGGDFTAVKSAYSDQDLPLMVQVEGSISATPDGDNGLGHSLTVSRFVQSIPSMTCVSNRTMPSLFNTYWTIDSLQGVPLEAGETRQEPYLLFQDGDQPTYFATVGCNLMRGQLTRSGDAISFGAGIATLMACPPPLNELERSFAEVLGQTKEMATSGETLVLFSEDGTVIATLRAAYY
ncbi:MAG: META domain-containing protein [Pseudomonadota bacterium]